MHVLHLTPEESVIFSSLPAALREGWQIQEEALHFEDSHQKHLMRLELLRVHDPKLQRIRESVRKAASIEEAVRLLQEEDLENVDEDDIAQLFFAMGPDVLTQLIKGVLSSIEKDEQVEQLTALTTIRHAILASYQPVSAFAP